MKKKIIIAAVAAMGMANVAFAATVVPSVTPVEFTTATVAASKVDVPATATTFTITSALAVQAADTITFTLSGGAKFDATTWATTVAAATFLADTVNNNPTVTGCTLDTGMVVLTCTGGVAAAGTGVVFTIPTSALYDLDLATASATMTVVVSRSVLGTATVIHTPLAADLANSVVVNVNASIAKNVDVISGGSQIATVANLFKSFAGNTSMTATTSVGGASITGDYKHAASAATGKYLLTLTGLPTAASAVTLTGFTGATAAGAATTATLGGNFWLDGAGNGYALLTTSGAATVVPDLTALVVIMDGATAITAGTVQLAVSYLAGTSDVFADHSILAASTTGVITRNGSNISLSLITAGTSLELINNDASGGAGTITITAVDAAGVAIADTGLATNAMPTAVAPGVSVTILGTDLAAAFPAAARVDFVIEAGDVTASSINIVPTVGADVNTIRTGSDSAL